MEQFLKEIIDKILHLKGEDGKQPNIYQAYFNAKISGYELDSELSF